MYTNDSFFTLSPASQSGLVLLSFLLVVVTFRLAHIVFRPMRRWPLVLQITGRIAGALAVFWVFVWLSPQVYYFYYQILFDNLPWQIVVATPPDVDRLWQLARFGAQPTLSDHGKGMIAWGLVAFAVLGPLWRRAR